MAQDVVRGGDVKVNVRQRVTQQEHFAAHRFVPTRQTNLAGFAVGESRRFHGIQVRDGFGDAFLQFGKSVFLVFKTRRFLPGQS